MDLQIKFWQYISKPSINISILIASYNTKIEFINDCLKSIGEQVGNFGIELVWVNDGSSKHYSFLLENSLQCFKVGKKNLQVKYYKTRENKGLSYCLRYGVKVCSNDLIFRMDSDDIMINNRIIKQLAFMLSDPNCMMCGTDIIPFININGNTVRRQAEAIHPEKLTWNEYLHTKKTWILNHPTICFRKSAVLEVGNYNKELRLPFEDLDLELRILKKYGYICNINEKLILYRIHPQQITNQNRDKSIEHEALKKELIEAIINVF